ncbi:hypothetical protein HOG75_04435 [bacterium]|jgi:hypothetical protein|nr:hypothetical protein [bacterium]
MSIFVVFIILAVFAIKQAFWSTDTENMIVSLESQEQIQEYAKIFVQPFYNQETKTFSIKIQLESYQLSDYMNTDLKENSVLENESDIVLQPQSWQLLKKTEYQKEGILTFSTFEYYPKKIVFTIFEDPNIIFEWTLP